MVYKLINKMLSYIKKILCLIFTLVFIDTLYASSFNYVYTNYDKDNYCKSTWQWLDIDSDGVYECYYFNVLGNVYKNGITPDGNRVNELGQLIINDKVQRKTLLELYELFGGKFDIPATKSDIANQNSITESIKVIELKDDFNKKLNDYILAKIKELQVHISEKNVDKRLLVDLEGLYVKNMNNIYNEYYSQIIKLYNDKDISKKDVNDAKKIVIDLYNEKERELKAIVNLMSKDIMWEFDRNMLKEKRKYLLDVNY